jgi:UDP-MurNAc hydroxylase
MSHARNSGPAADACTRLKFQFIANASGIFIGRRGTTVLCDPWLVDGVFEGSWCHCPKLSTTIDDVMDVDAIYVSHLHPDHFDERHFRFAKTKPLLVLDHGPNFLIRKLSALGYTNLIKVKDGETIPFEEFKITMFAPFAKHNFHEAAIGNLIDSAMLIECDGISALNTNDNTPTVESARVLKEKYGQITLAMLNYNAAGPYPSCFDNLTIDEKTAEHHRLLQRNFEYMKDVVIALGPKYVMPFAGAYVLGGDFHYKNAYLGTATWEECADWLKEKIAPVKPVVLREGDTFLLDAGQADRPYVPLDTAAMAQYVTNELSRIRYPYQLDEQPDPLQLAEDIRKASDAMKGRMQRFGISSKMAVILKAFGKPYRIYPDFAELDAVDENCARLECEMDERLLRRVLDKKSHWNNAENGAHVTYFRSPNIYEPDLHTGLQFFQM